MSIIDESDHDGVEQESFSEQGKVHVDRNNLSLRNIRGYKISDFGGRSFPLVRLAGRQSGWPMEI